MSTSGDDHDGPRTTAPFLTESLDEVVADHAGWPDVPHVHSEVVADNLSRDGGGEGDLARS